MGGGVVTRKEEPLVNIKSVHYSAPHPIQRDILQNVSFSVFSKEFVSIIGPSGVGKTTLLRLLAGIIKPTSGKIEVQGKEPSALRGRIGLMFQDYTAFPWLSVEKNIRFGLTNQNDSNHSTEVEVKRLLNLAKLEDYPHYYPKQLSGGQKQRLALARTLALEPPLLLLDEPFGALDAVTRMQVQQSLQELYDEFHPATILVTHDIEEALLLSDRIIVLGGNPGSVKAVLQNPFQRPRQENRFTPEFQKYKHDLVKLLEQELTWFSRQ